MHTAATQWGSTYDNLWNLQFTPDGQLQALASSSGVWTLVQDVAPWHTTSPVLTDLNLSPDGKRAAAVGQCCLGFPRNTLR